jgi:tetratricopeptide (TPR) repeat protein
LKQKIEFEAELERSVAPDSSTRSAITAAPAVATVSGRVTATAEDTAAHPASSAEYIVSEIKRHKTGAGLIGALFVLAVGAAVFFYFNRAQALTDKDTVLLADFANSTGEPVFDGTLKQALAVQLGQSPFLNIFPEERVREALRFMGRSPDDRLTRDVAREICERQGLKAMLTGSISSLGSHYVITLEAVNAHSGDSIAREQVEANSKEQVLSALGNAASALRGKLGESLSSIKKFEVPVEQATTSSLEALKAFATGNDERAKGNVLQSATFYKRAIELDPNFAMAYARLAVHYGNQEQLELAQQYVQKAYELRDRVSERERFYISEKYFNYSTGELDKRVEVLQTWARLYPNDYIPHNNLALNYNLLGRYDEGVKEALEAVRLSPNAISARDNLISSFLGLNRLDEAEQAVKELGTQHPDSAALHFNKLYFAFLHGDLAGIDAVAQWARGKPVEADMISQLGSLSFHSGQFKKGEEFKKRAIELFKNQDRKENAAQTLIGLASNEALFGKCEQAKENVVGGLALVRARTTIPSAALVFAYCNDVGKAKPLLDEALKLYPTDTIIVSIIAPVINAVLEMKRGNGAEAIKLMESVRAYDFGFIAGPQNSYVRGLAYLQQKSGNEAATEFQKVIDHPAIDAWSTVHPLARLGLARAAAMSGDIARSRKAYQDLFAMWKNADADLPVLLEAKKEYEQLK